MPLDFRRIVQNVYFRRLMISFSAMAVLISLLCGAILLREGTQSVYESFSQTGKMQLSEARSYMEGTYLNSFKNAFISDVLSTITPGGSEDVLYHLYNGSDPNLYQIFRLAGNLKTAVSDNKGIENISIYFNNIGYIVDKDSFYSLTGNSPKYHLIANLDRLPIHRWFPHKVSYDGLFEEDLISYVHTFPFNADRGRADGYMFIDIQTDRLRESLDLFRRDPAEKLLMYSNQEDFVIGSSNVSQEEWADMKQKILRNMEEGKTEDGTYFSYIPATDSNLDWTFASVRPTAAIHSELQQMRWRVFYVCIGIMVVGVAVSLYLSLKLYEPVRRMLIKLKEHNDNLFPVQQQNEFKVIDHVLTGLNMTIKQLAVLVDSNKLNALLEGRLLEDELPNYLRASSCFVAVKVKLGCGCSEQWTMRLSGTPAPYPYEIVTHNERELTVLYYAVDEEQPNRRIFEHLAAVAEEGGKETAFYAGIGGTAVNAEGIHVSNRQAEQALKYIFMEAGRIIDYEEICLRSETPIIHFEPFEQALRAGHQQAVEQFIDEFERTMNQSRYPLEAIELSLLQMTVTMSKVMIDINNKESMFSSTLLFQDIRKDTFQRTMEGIREQSVRIARHIQQHLLHNMQYEAIYKLKQYIDTHLYEDISLDRLSELAALSPPYISKQFKEIMNVSFIEYLTNARMERACELLSADTVTVTEIASQVGFNNVQYFCSKFKQKHGVTPMQYRKSYKKSAVEIASDS